MKIKAFLLSLLFAGLAFGQLSIKYPTNVRYIGGGYNNVQPYFKTLEAALNNVKAYATPSNPYTFWVSSDTLYIADWDSVFTQSGYTMKDSIDIYYVSTGSIKWAGFGFGGGGGGNVSISEQTQSTIHYQYYNWDQYNTALPVWQRRLARTIDSVDQHIYDLIVYTKSPLYIENDTLKLNVNLLPQGGINIDTTRLAYLDKNITWTYPHTYNTTLTISGSLRLALSNGNYGTSRIIWGDNYNIFYSGSGTDNFKIPSISNTTRKITTDSLVTYTNLDYDLKRRTILGGTAQFSGTDTVVTVITGDSTNIITVTPIYTTATRTITTSDANLVVIPINNGFIIKRPSGGSSNLIVAWIRRIL